MGYSFFRKKNMGMMIQTDFHIFQRGGSTTNQKGLIILTECTFCMVKLCETIHFHGDQYMTVWEHDDKPS